jgi:hypothetical protein
MVHDDGLVGLDGLRVEFDDERAVQHAGVALVATLACRLGIESLAERLAQLRDDRPGAANAGRKVLALLFAMVLGADSIDDCELLRAGRTRRLLGGWMPAPSTLGTFLRAFKFGHVGLGLAGSDEGSDPRFRPRERRVFWHAKSEEVPRGVVGARHASCVRVRSPDRARRA